MWNSWFSPYIKTKQKHILITSEGHKQYPAISSLYCRHLCVSLFASKLHHSNCTPMCLKPIRTHVQPYWNTLATNQNTVALWLCKNLVCYIKCSRNISEVAKAAQCVSVVTVWNQVMNHSIKIKQESPMPCCCETSLCRGLSKNAG